jgi:hypothetical protein
VQLMGPAAPVKVQVYATQVIMFLAEIADHVASISAAGAIPRLVQFLDPGDGPPAVMQGFAAATLGCLAAVNAEDSATIAASGAISLMVQLLKPGSPAGVQQSAISALWSLAANSDSAVTIATAGAIPPLAQLSRSGADATIKDNAKIALEAIRNGVAANRAAVVAAKASALMVQEMEALGVDSPSDAQTS